jgi:hypothetical protein
MNTKQPVDPGPEPDLQEHRRLITRALVRSAARRAERMTMHAERMAINVVDRMAARLDRIEVQLDRIDARMRYIDDAMTKFVDAFRAYKRRVENEQQQ